MNAFWLGMAQGLFWGIVTGLALLAIAVLLGVIPLPPLPAPILVRPS